MLYAPKRTVSHAPKRAVVVVMGVTVSTTVVGLICSGCVHDDYIVFSNVSRVFSRDILFRKEGGTFEAEKKSYPKFKIVCVCDLFSFPLFPFLDHVHFRIMMYQVQKQ